MKTNLNEDVTNITFLEHDNSFIVKKNNLISDIINISIKWDLIYNGEIDDISKKEYAYFSSLVKEFMLITGLSRNELFLIVNARKSNSFTKINTYACSNFFKSFLGGV